MPCPLRSRAAVAPAEFLEHRRDGSLRINPRNERYALIIATALDALLASGGSYARAAQALGLTTSQLMRFLEADREVWRAVETVRKTK